MVGWMEQDLLGQSHMLYTATHDKLDEECVDSLGEAWEVKLICLKQLDNPWFPVCTAIASTSPQLSQPQRDKV